MPRLPRKPQIDWTDEDFLQWLKYEREYNRRKRFSGEVMAAAFLCLAIIIGLATLQTVVMTWTP